MSMIPTKLLSKQRAQVMLKNVFGKGPSHLIREMPISSEDTKSYYKEMPQDSSKSSSYDVITWRFYNNEISFENSPV